MFNPTADVGCKAMRVVFTWTGKSRSRCETGASIAAYETRDGSLIARKCQRVLPDGDVQP
jgi:hypothetical protein